MYKKILFKTMLLLCALVAGSGSVWADDVLVYTLTPASGTNNSYASNCDITINGISWNLTGNSQQIPWRIGGKSLSGVDRTLYSKTAMSDNISKIEVTHGTASSITVNSWTVIVSKNSDFSSPVSTLTPTFEANTTTTITRPDGADWSDCYFKFVYNVSVSGSSNKFVEFTKAEFYKSEGGDIKTDPTITFNNGSVRVGKTLDLSTLFESDSEGAVTYSITAGGSYATLSGSTLSGVAEGSVTVKAEQEATNSYNAGEATATITVNPALVLSSIAITTAPTKTTYNAGETFDPTGMVVTATYTDNSTEAVTGYTYSPNGALATTDTEITISYTENSVTKTTTQAITVNEVVDYATLPFEWTGGSSADFTALNGVTASVGSDYAQGNAPYLIKFDGNGKYIQVKTDSQPGKVTINVKMIGGGNTSTITVQGSADGNAFNDVETLTISGSQNDVLTLETTNGFAPTDRYVKLYFTKGSNVGVGAITIAKASTDPAINAASSVELTAEATSGEIEYTISNPVGGTSLTAAEKTDVDWISNVTVATDKVTFTTTVNTGNERTATITLTYGSVTKDVTVKQAAYVAPVATTTYTLATAVVPGRHYIITNVKSDGKVKAMGTQNPNNRAAVEINVNGEVASVTANDAVVEFLIGVDNDGFFTIYDAAYDNNTGGYLYAAGAGGTGSNNHLKTQTINTQKGQWKITIDANGIATIKANDTGRNWMRFNSNNSPNIFSCYASGQKDICLYEKVGDTGSQDFTASINVACTDGSKYYGTFSAPFAFTVPSDVTVSEIAVANETLSVSNYSEGAVIPANTGVMISSTTAGDKTFTSAVGGTSVLGTDNCLHPTIWGVTDTEMAAADANCLYYRLTMHEGTTIGFWWGATGGAAFDVAANKAYLAVPNGNGAKMGFTFGADGEATAIETINNNQYSNNRCYNLNGQQVSGNYKGIVIVNGKKVMNK